MIKAQIISQWTEVVPGDFSPYLPLFESGDKWESKTQALYPLPDPNSVVLEVLVSSATFEVLDLDPDLFILWDIPNPKPPHGVPNAAEFGLLRAYLAKNGWKQKQINDAIGTKVNGRNRLEITYGIIRSINLQVG